MLTELIFFFILILLSGFFSATEIAIASFGANKIEELKEKNDKSAFAFEKVQKEPNIFFGTVQFVTSLSLLAAAMDVYILISGLINRWITNASISWLYDYTGVITFLLSLLIAVTMTLIFGILIPKAIGFKYSEKIGKSAVHLMLFLNKIFRYPIAFITAAGNVLLRPFKEKTDFSQTRFSEDEIRIIISEGVKTGAIDETEHAIIENIFEFNDLKANEVMVPRTEMVAVEMLDDIAAIAGDILKTNHSLVPVYVDSPDNIVGVLHTKDFMKSYIDNKTVNLKSLIRPAYFVPETKLISQLLREMQTRGERLAIVTDEYGGTEGVITIEDILEEIVGDIRDNTKLEVKEYSKLPDGKYYILGSMTIDDFNETFTAKLPSSDEYNTVAGFIADKTGKILNSGEAFEFEGLMFELIKKIRQKMVQFRVYSKEGVFSEEIGK